MKEIQILNNGESLHDIRTKINENFRLTNEKIGTIASEAVKFSVNSGNETDGLADLLIREGATLTFKVGGEYPNLVVTDGKGLTKEITSLNPLNMAGLSTGTYVIVTDGANTQAVRSTKFHYQLLEPTEFVEGDIWFNGEGAYIYDTTGENSGWVDYPFVPIGEALFRTNAIAVSTTYPYNQNGLVVATTSSVGMLRVAAEPDLLDCSCNNAVITPSNLYNLSNYRLANTEYQVGDKVGCPYSHNLQLKCITAGTTSEESLKTTNLNVTDTIQDGSVVWRVEELGTGSGGGLNLFDTKTTDHILQGEEAKGWALQGTYVYKEAVLGEHYGYPTFYETCLEEKTNASVEAVTLGNNTVDMHVADNGHIYYDIKDKAIVDAWFNLYGMAWFYGVDIENESIFLPRNNWFEQMTGKEAEVADSVTAGLPNITGNIGTIGINGTVNGAFLKTGTAGLIANNGEKDVQVKFDASRSNSIYGNSNTVQPNAIKKLLYICVGNTEFNISRINVVEEVESGIKEIQEVKNLTIQKITTLSENATSQLENTSNEAQQSITNLSDNSITQIEGLTNSSVEQISNLSSSTMAKLQSTVSEAQSNINESMTLADMALDNATTALANANEALTDSNNAVEQANQTLQKIEQVEEKAEQALMEAENAAMYSDYAKESEENALLYANQAKDYAEQTEQQVSQASQSANASAQSADRAQEILNSIEGNENITIILENQQNIETVANNIEDIRKVEENKNIVLTQTELAIAQTNLAKEQAELSTYNATTATIQANLSLEQAAIAQDSADLASQYVQQAKQSAETATSCADTSTEQANIATEQSGLALTYSTTAKQSETNAKQSETNAKNSENKAKESENKAKEYADKAELSGDYSEACKSYAEIAEEKANMISGQAELAKKWAIGDGYVEHMWKSARVYAQEAENYKNNAASAASSVSTSTLNAQMYATNAQSYASSAMSASASALYHANKAKEYAEQAGGSSLGLPTGAYVYLSNTEHYPLDNLVYCNGTEYTKEEFNDFYMNYLYALPEVTEPVFTINDNTVTQGEEQSDIYITNFNSPVTLNMNQPEMFLWRLCFHTGDDITTKQIVYESPSDGSMLYIENGYFYTENGILWDNDNDENYYVLPNQEYGIMSYTRGVPADEENPEGLAPTTFVQTIDWNFHPEKEMWGTLTHVDYDKSYNFGYSSNDEYSSFLGKVCLWEGHSYWIDTAMENMYPFYGDPSGSNSDMVNPATMKTKLAACSYEQYENEISEKGYCDKFALDLENEKFKVPTLLDNGTVKSYVVLS